MQFVQLTTSRRGWRLALDSSSCHMSLRGIHNQSPPVSTAQDGATEAISPEFPCRHTQYYIDGHWKSENLMVWHTVGQC